VVFYVAPGRGHLNSLPGRYPFPSFAHYIWTPLIHLALLLKLFGRIVRRAVALIVHLDPICPLYLLPVTDCPFGAFPFLLAAST